MKCIHLYLLMLLALLPIVLPAQEAKKPSAPAIPTEMNEQERALLSRVESLLAGEEFDRAEAILKGLTPPASVKVLANRLSVPKDSRAAVAKAVRDAMQAWNQAGDVRFQQTEREEEADLILLLEWDVARIASGQARLVCADVSFNFPPEGQAAFPERRIAWARIAVNQPYLGSVHAAPSLAHLAGQSLGSYLGLAETLEASDLMGPDTHTASVAVRPSESDLKRVRELQAIREKLMDFARKRAAVSVPRPVMEMAKSEIDVGDVWVGDNAPFSFPVKNAGDAPLEIDARSTCGCIVARSGRAIAPGAEDAITGEIRTAGYRGKLEKTIEVRANDPTRPRASLSLSVNILSVVHIEPSENLSFSLKDTEPTSKELTLTVRGTEPVEINRVSCSVPYATAELQSLPSDSGKAYRVVVTVRSEAPVGRIPFMVTAFTTSRREPQIPIYALCEKGIMAVPVSVYMGNITSATRLPVTQILTLIKKEGAFHIRQVTSSDANLQTEMETLRDGSQYRISVTYNGGWQADASIRSMVIVETDDPRQPRIEIPVIASVASGK
ncbi:MAG: DUF1573 domain-containing protein [Armatimonadetes bacterium]|nr:DUF1573 domain-containing protein [Armatimonadota bacterium]